MWCSVQETQEVRGRRFLDTWVHGCKMEAEFDFDHTVSHMIPSSSSSPSRIYMFRLVYYGWFDYVGGSKGTWWRHKSSKPDIFKIPRGHSNGALPVCSQIFRCRTQGFAVPHRPAHIFSTRFSNSRTAGRTS